MSTTKTVSVADCAGQMAFGMTGTVQTFVVPVCAVQVTIDALGASGGDSAVLGGFGGRAKGTATVTGGESLYVFVGGRGTNVNGTGSLQGFAGGFNGGGAVHEYTTWTTQGEGPSGTGGGASDVRRGGMDLSNRIIVAAGGGGAGATGGGAGGGATGVAAPNQSASALGGGGGTQAAGGVGTAVNATYPTKSGVLGGGGDAYRDGSPSGGGGGGYYGGGGGEFAGGGGGSSYITGLMNAMTITGAISGDGAVILSWSGPAT